MATTGDVFRVVLDGRTVDSQTWQNVWHFYVSSGTSVDYPAILTAIEATFDTNYALIESQLSTSVTTNDIILSEWDFTNHEWDGKAQSSAGCLTGILAVDDLPAGNAVVIKFFTEELRRQGRKFIPGIVETLCTGNDLGAGLVTAAVNFAAASDNSISADGLTLLPCTFSDDAASVRYETHSLFSGSYFVNSKSGYQRRRQVGAGI